MWPHVPMHRVRPWLDLASRVGIHDHSGWMRHSELGRVPDRTHGPTPSADPMLDPACGPVQRHSFWPMGSERLSTTVLNMNSGVVVHK